MREKLFEEFFNTQHKNDSFLFWAWQTNDEGFV
jgi:hypothetical protein